MGVGQQLNLEEPNMSEESRKLSRLVGSTPSLAPLGRLAHCRVFQRDRPSDRRTLRGGTRICRLAFLQGRSSPVKKAALIDMAINLMVVVLYAINILRVLYRRMSR